VGVCSCNWAINVFSKQFETDIAFATHQCVRFSHAPKTSHANAVKLIVRYLKGTAENGLIIKPRNLYELDCYVDADFAGLYIYEDDQDPVCVKSRTDYVLLLAVCPVLWVSKLQTKITVSTMEAEYVALSQAMRDLIPMRRTMSLICDTVLGKGKYEARMRSNVFEDNQGTLQLARAPRMPPRTKHYGVNEFFLCDHVTRGEIKLFK
jgi:hypothetical protein